MRKPLRFIALIAIFAACTATIQAQYNLIPQPISITTTADGYVVPKSITKIQLQPGAIAPIAEYQEAYELEITPDAITISAYSSQGFIWAERTLQQLRQPDGSYPQVKIADRPEFPIRGFMYDTGRNFIEVDQIKQFIDLCSRYKLNTFHWHLTDKPAWRIESRAYPQLNDAKYQRIGRDEGRFYTYAEIHDVIDYARERGVMIIPEIDMPGHSDYFNATFGTGMNSPEGMAILQTCLQEFFDEFPPDVLPYMHIGSDEIHIDNPKEFMEWAVALVESNGRIPLVWDPGLPASDNTIYQVWRDGSANGAEIPAEKKILDSYMGYLNYVDPLIFTNKCFLHQPGTTGWHDANNLGGILCMWNDVRVIDNAKLPSHNGMMGGMLPFAERFWRGGEGFECNGEVLFEPAHPDMQKLVEFQDRVSHHRAEFLPDLLDYWMPNIPEVEWDITLADSIGNVLHAGKAYGCSIDFDAYAKHYGIEGVEYASISRTIYADRDTLMQARIGFDAPARSNRISDGIALQGQWENFGKVVVNDTEVLPPVWNEPGLYKYHFNTWARPEEELPYTDEQFYWTREPIKIHLMPGENKVTLSTRKHFQGQHFQAAMLLDGPWK